LSNSNATAAIKEVHYENKIYQVQNHFFAFDIEAIKTWKITDSNIFNSLLNAKNRFGFFLNGYKNKIFQKRQNLY
jgi:hypothetical protein